MFIDKEKINQYVDKQFKQFPAGLRHYMKKTLQVMPSSFLSIGACIWRTLNEAKYLLHFYYKFPRKNGLNTSESRDKKIIVSLTTIPSRIRYVPYVLGAMMRQTKKPDKIILNLGEELFTDVKLPFLIRLFENAGVDIVYNPDLKPHTKYYYTMKNYPQELVITVDDDILYPRDLIEVLYSSYLKHPNAVSCFRAHLMKFNLNGTLQSYLDWSMGYSSIIDTPAMNLCCTAVGGVIYPPNCMHFELYSIDKLKALSYKADDIWLKFMQVMQNTPVVVVRPYRGLITVASHQTQKIALCHSNVSENANDLQIQNVLKQYNEYFGEEDTLLKRIRDSAPHSK